MGVWAKAWGRRGTRVFGRHFQSQRDTAESRGNIGELVRCTTTRGDSYRSIKSITAPHPTGRRAKAREFHPRQDWELPAQKGIISKQPHNTRHDSFSEQHCTQKQFSRGGRVQPLTAHEL